jgi:4-amino-4-deoxy-L-arabinose transferase-like glycosyltransferase
VGPLAQRLGEHVYAGAVRSTATGWHAFLHGSLDAGGVMTVDKPRLALWVQALSVRVFGFHTPEPPRAPGR